MARPGGGGGGSRSVGSRPSMRSSGGHRVGGGSRPGGGSFRSGRPGGGFGGSRPGGRPGGGFGGRPGGMGGPGRMPGMGGYRRVGAPPPPRGPRGAMRPGRPVRGSSGMLTFIILLIIVLFMFNFISRSMTMGIGNSITTSTTASTRNREKLDSGISFDRDCVIDEVEYTSNPSSLGKNLDYFYDKTGIQPYIVLKAYDAKVEGNEEEYAQEWYEENIDNESTFLYMYFEAENPEDVGYMCYVNGRQVDSVMDSEAIEIFWGYVDRYWYSDLDTDEMFETVFRETADTIMTRQRTTQDVLTYVVIGAVILLAVYGIYKIIKLRAQRKKEEAEETERILNADLNKMSDDIADKVAEKYEN